MTVHSATLWAPAITVGGALVIIALERLRPYDRQRFWRRGLGVDLIGYALVQSAVLSVVINGLVRARPGVKVTPQPGKIEADKTAG